MRPEPSLRSRIASFDLGVTAVIGLDLCERLAAVGDEGVVAQIGEELCLSADQSGAANDEPPPAECALGDPGDPVGRVVLERLPALLVDLLD